MIAVLVVDDEPGVRRLLEIFLRETGCRVRLAADAEAAMATIEEEDPDIVLTDIRLPGMDGIELADRIRNDGHHHQAQVILMSAYGKPHHLSSDDFVPKPFDLESLVATIRSRVE